MKERFLNKINNPAVRKELESLFDEGLKINEEHLEEFQSVKPDSNLLQVFPMVKEERIVRNINVDLSSAENIFLIVRADQGLYWKATELVKFLSERTSAKIVWNFHPSEKMEQIMKIVTISY